MARIVITCYTIIKTGRNILRIPITYRNRIVPNQWTYWLLATTTQKGESYFKRVYRGEMGKVKANPNDCQSSIIDQMIDAGQLTFGHITIDKYLPKHVINHLPNIVKTILFIHFNTGEPTKAYKKLTQNLESGSYG